VRATLIKHIEGMFDFREAHDGEQAWETLLLDPSIRVVITDLTMPKLDGYGLLQRIRSSQISRIRNVPVIVVSGSDEQAERDRAKAAGATDLITKGIGTAQLLSRLDILSNLIGSQDEFDRGLEALVRGAPVDSPMELFSPEKLKAQADAILASALRNKKNFVILHIRLGIVNAVLEGGAASPPVALVDAVGRLLQRTVRQTDCVAKTGEADFTIAAGSINFDAARFLAQRVCRAIANANLVTDDRLSFIACAGVDSLSDYAAEEINVNLEAMCEAAHRRATLGLNRGITGAVGLEEERAFQQGIQQAESQAESQIQTQPELVQAKQDESDNDAPDLATLVQWIKEGKREQVLPHIGKLSPELRPLVDLVLQRGKP
jgi:CheY-like chemotaxis protein